MKVARSYSSPLRAEQAAMTRDRIVDAAVDLLSRGDAAEIGMQDVADHAGVSVRTVYRYFATREDLFDGIVGAINERMEAVSGPPPAVAADYLDPTRDPVGAVFELEPLYRALFATQAGRESHQRGARQRRAAIAAAFASELDRLGDTEKTLFGALIHLLSSSNSVLFLKDYWGLDPDEVRRLLRWATGVVTDAVRDPGLKEKL